MMRNFFFCARSSIHHFPTRRKLHFLLQAKIRLNVKQISKQKKIVFVPDSSKATIVSKAFYNSERSYSPIPEAFSSFLNVFLDLFARSPTNSRTDRLSTKNAGTEDLLRVSTMFFPTCRFVVLLLFRVAVYLSNFSKQGKVVFFCSKHYETKKITTT